MTACRSRRTSRLICLCAVIALGVITPEPSPTEVGGRSLAATPRVDRSHGAAGDAPTLPSGVAADWWTAVRAQIEQDAYAVRPVADTAPGTYEADNPGQRWKARFSSMGVAITPMRPPARDPRETRHSRTPVDADSPGTSASTTEAGSDMDLPGAVADWTVGLRLVAYGVGDDLTPMPVVAPRAEGGRVEFRHGDSHEGAPALSEWYVNEKGGIEHGFTLAEAPAGAGQVTLKLAVTGELQPALQQDGLVVELRGPDGVVRARYADLIVTDASGRTLPATLSVLSGESAHIRLTLDTRGAVYPVTIDPLLTEPPTTLTGEAANNHFGFPVAPAGDVNGDGYSDVLVGAYGYGSDTGRVYLYLGGASGLATTPATTLTGEAVGDMFGYTVATAGDVNGDGYADVTVGAPGRSANTGRAYVYLGGPGGLATTAATTLTGETAGDFFGAVVAPAGDVNGDGYADAVVGAPYFSGAAGRVYVYLGGPSGLATTTATTLTGESAGINFGFSVATAGDVNGDSYADLVVGAYGYATNTGKVYVYLGGASGLSTTASTTVLGETAGDYFGFSVAPAGDVNGDGYADIVIGAFWYQSATGRAYVFLGGATGLAATAPTILTGVAPGTNFGVSVATAGDVNGDGYADVVVAAEGTGSLTGLVSVYLGGASGLATTAATTLSGEVAGDSFGRSVATAGDVNGDGYADLVVGAHAYNSSTGRAHVYLGGGSGVATTAATTWTGEAGTYSDFGRSVASAGDVNGDGYADVVVGAYYYDYSGTGRVYLYLGGPNGLATTPATILTGETAGNEFGYVVATAGDVNGDGYADVIVGETGYVRGYGRVYVYLGGPGGLATTPATTLTGAVDEQVGWSAGTAGDVNGDGYADVLVGAAGSGRAYVYLGGAGGLATTPATTLTGAAGDQFGCSVATAGDVNGDGYADVVVGAKSYNNWDGKAYLFLGGASGLVTSPATTMAGAGREALGASVATAGDVNGDGYADVLIGAGQTFTGAIGRVYLYLGGANGLGMAPAATLDGVGTNESFGYSIGTAGDVNGDGYADIVVGAPGYVTATGRVYVYLGGASGLTTTPSTTLTGETTSNSFGVSVATAGDVNGDGYADVVVGADAYDYYVGRAYVYLGGGGPGRSLAPRARQADNSAPIAHGGRSESMTAFRLAAIAHSPFGRTQVKLEWEVKPLGTSFTGSGTSRSTAWLDSTMAGTSFNELVSGLTRATSYHWRVRVRYHSASSPFAQHSRWVTQPWVGAQESRLRTKNAAPTVSQIYPASGSTLGGTVVTINGTGFVQGATVTIGGVAASDVTVTNATTLTLVTAAHAEGVVDVVVANRDAQAATIGGSFTYVAMKTPVITWATPASIGLGTALSSTQLNATASFDGAALPGTFAYTPDAGIVLAEGTHTLSTTFTPTDNVYYTTATKTVDLVVLPAPTMVAAPASLYFGAVKAVGSATLSSQTLAQTVVITFGGASSGWTATTTDPWLSITGGSGTGAGTFTVAIVNPGDTIGASTSLSGAVTMTSPSASNSPLSVPVTLTVSRPGASALPFGAFDTPGDGTTGMQGSFAVTGWALDDVAIDRVEIWRDLVPGEDGRHAYITDPAHPAFGKVFIANPLFVTDARPDVESFYPSYPFANRAGWGYLLLSWGLEGQGNGPYTLYAYAFDVDGHSASLGTKTIAVDNAHASKPFGSIDTPGYGETRSGTFVNFGWALTPAGDASCRIDNGHVFVTVDSLPAALVSYGDARADIAASFPGFLNSANASGAYYVNTTTLTNGRHQIGWLVYDNCGRGDGIGSRFFNVLNGGARPTGDAGAAADAPGLQTRPTLGPDASGLAALSAGEGKSRPTLQADPGRGVDPAELTLRPLAGQEPGDPRRAARAASDQSLAGRRDAGSVAPAAGGTVAVRHLGGDWQDVPADADGGRLIDVMQGGRIEVRLPPAAGGAYTGHLAVNAERRSLPVGSSLDMTAGIFYWQPDPAFFGAFDLVFEAPGTDAVRVRVVVK
ncbi:MAG: FG-GAP-like repeat-containing protein [Acidobacteria bacterium]|nr:FG-GAP-like repeat-containing protein [Acidobacteriota bacterium]